MSHLTFSFACRDLILNSPLVTSHATITLRRVIILAARTSDGEIAVSESAPLPEFGTESFDAAMESVRALCARGSFPALPENTRDTTEWIREVGISSRESPTVAFAVDCSLTELIAKRQNVHPAKLLSAYPFDEMRVNALLSGSTIEEVVESARQAAASGYDTAKIKVGTRAIAEDSELVKRLRQELPALGLRADANGAWTLVEACAFGHDVEQYDLEYLEDPVRELNVEELVALQETCPVPIALDRFARRAEDVQRILDRDLCDVLVLKPSTIGTLSELAALSLLARQQDVKVVISSLLESSVGLGWLAICASAFGSGELAHGLGTATLLHSDTLRRPFVPVRGRVQLHDARTRAGDLTDDLQSELQIVRDA